MLGLKIRTLHVTKYPHSFRSILSWMLCSHPSPITSPPEASITPSLASCYAPSGSFQSTKKTQCEYPLLVWIHRLTYFTAYSITRSRMQQSGCVPMTNETGRRSSTPQALSITSTSLTRTYFGGRFLSGYVLSHFALSGSRLKYLQTLRMIYTGKSSAFTGHRSAPKPSQAEMHGMREVFPEAVAYAAVQVSIQ